MLLPVVHEYEPNDVISHTACGTEPGIEAFLVKLNVITYMGLVRSGVIHADCKVWPLKSEKDSMNFMEVLRKTIIEGLSILTV